MPKKRKPGPRTKSGQLSKAYKRDPACRDFGTPELQRKKLSAVNGSADPTLSASASRILFAHEIISRDQLEAADTYHKLYRRCFGLPDYGTCLLNDRSSAPAMDEEAQAQARKDFERLAAVLSPEQKLSVDALVIAGWMPRRGSTRPD